MIKFTTPKNFNGAELCDELAAVGVEINLESSPLIDENNDLWLDIKDDDEAKAEKIVLAHNGTLIPKEPTIADKLKSVGLNLEDLKTALGI